MVTPAAVFRLLVSVLVKEVSYFGINTRRGTRQFYSITDEVTNLYDNFKFGVAITKIMECVQMVCVV